MAYNTGKILGAAGGFAAVGLMMAANGMAFAAAATWVTAHGGAALLALAASNPVFLFAVAALSIIGGVTAGCLIASHVLRHLPTETLGQKLVFVGTLALMIFGLTTIPNPYWAMFVVTLGAAAIGRGLQSMFMPQRSAFAAPRRAIEATV